MAIYQLFAEITERYGAFHVRVVATSPTPGSGVIAREHECYSRESANMTLDVLTDQVRTAIEAIGGSVEDGRGFGEKPAEPG